MRQFTNDEILEYLIRKHHDGLLEAMKAMLQRETTIEDFIAMERAIKKRYEGWVTMNGNIRKLGKS